MDAANQSPLLDDHFLSSYLLSLLDTLSEVEQSARYHPEGNALYHSLQVFHHAIDVSDDPNLWAAALFHDVGKAQISICHAKAGGQWLKGLLSNDIVWLVEHHLDLLKHPRSTRKKYQGQKRLLQLETLRRLDLAGRDKYVDVMTPESAVAYLRPYYAQIVAKPPEHESCQ